MDRGFFGGFCSSDVKSFAPCLRFVSTFYILFFENYEWYLSFYIGSFFIINGTLVLFCPKLLTFFFVYFLIQNIKES